jgi:predicted metal-binding transcription factor (methanogenesis marker protein 9)
MHCSQIKVRDLSAMRIEVSPAEFGSWSDARAQLIVDEKRPLKAQLQSELSSASTDAAADEIRSAFATREAALEHQVLL